MQFLLADKTFIPLSTEIRDWVLLPLFIITVCSTYLRQDIMKLFSGNSKPDPRSQQETTILQKASIFVERYSLLSSKTIKKLKNYFVSENSGILTISAAPQAEGTPNVPQMDFGAMLGGNSIMMITNVGLMTWINAMFDGFIVLKTPFPLSYRFKLLTQQGLGGMNIDVSYVSSLGWYLLVLFGGKYILQLFDSKASSMTDMAQMTGVPSKAKTPSIGGIVAEFTAMAGNVQNIDIDEYMLKSIEEEVMNDLNVHMKTEKDKKKPKTD
ncbi:ER membrane protein complex subunit 3 [Entamoeba marina]